MYPDNSTQALSTFCNNTNITEATTLVLADSGVVQNVQGAYTVTLPTGTVGMRFIIRVGAPNVTVTIAPQSTDTISGGGLTATEGADLKFTDQPEGSYVELDGTAANAYTISKVFGTVTN